MGLAALSVAALLSLGALHASCKDTIEPGVPVDASDNDDVDSVHDNLDEAGEASTPDRDASGEPPRDAARPPTDAATPPPPPADARPG
jgi:hypothetical protein